MDTKEIDKEGNPQGLERNNSPFRIIISGGGTGGHIFPAIAIANEIKRRKPDTEILFVGAENRMEMEKVPAAGYRIVGLNVVGLNRKPETGPGVRAGRGRGRGRLCQRSDLAFGAEAENSDFDPGTEFLAGCHQQDPGKEGRQDLCGL